MSTKEKILETALTLFAKNGYDGTSVEQIAQDVGIKAPSLYKHFKGKEDILNSLIDIAEARYEESFGSAKKIGTIPENIDGFIHETMKKIRFTMSDPIIKKMRIFLVQEQFRSERLAEITTRHQVDGLLQMYKKILETLMDAGVIDAKKKRSNSSRSTYNIFLRHTQMETDRFLLRPWRECDAEALFKYASDPDVGPRAGWEPHKSVEESLQIIRTIFGGDHMWAIELKETGEPIGCIGYLLKGESNIDIGENEAEAGYWIAKPYWNKGICTDALKLMIDYYFNEKHIDVLWSDFFIDNPASGRVMEKCGFRETGEMRYCENLYGGSKRPVKVMKLHRNG